MTKQIQSQAHTVRGRPKSSIPSVEKTLSLPSDLVLRVDLQLFSPLEERVPHGAWAKYVSRLIREDLERAARGQQTQSEGGVV